MESLLPPEIERLAPMGTTEITKRSQLRNHFDECIWESRRERLFAEVGAVADSDHRENFDPTSDIRDHIPPLHPPFTRV